MSDVRADEIAEPDDAREWTPDRIRGLKCQTREDGKKSHYFLDHSNKCQCGDVDLNAYREMVLR